MINPFKQAGEIKNKGLAIKKALDFKKEMSKIEAYAEKGRVKVTVGGDMKIKRIDINDEEMKDARDAINEAIDKVNKKSAEKMQQMGAGLQDLLGAFGQ